MKIPYLSGDDDNRLASRVGDLISENPYVKWGRIIMVEEKVMMYHKVILELVGGVEDVDAKNLTDDLVLIFIP